jgi:glycogen debranching enzyme
MTDAIQDFFDQLGRFGDDPRLRIRRGTVRCDVVQDGQTDYWFVSNTNGRIEVSRSSGDADLTIRGERAVFNALASGEMYVPTAALRGDLIIEGDSIRLLAFGRLFPRSNPHRRAAEPRGRAVMAQDLVTILDGSAFVAGDASGDIDASSADPAGLFFHDTRLLSKWILTVNGNRLVPLSVDNVHYFEVRFFLIPSRSETRAATTLSVVRERTICDGLCEVLTILNHDEKSVDLTIRVEVDSDFADFNEVGETSSKEGRYYREVEDAQLLLGYQRQQFYRETVISTTGSAQFDEHGLTLKTRIDPQGSWSTQLQAIPRRGAVPRDVGQPAKRRRGRSDMERDLEHWISHAPRLQTDWAPLNDIYQRSLVDLSALRFRSVVGQDPDYLFLAAGLPWFMAMFGRDSIIASLQALPFAPQLARTTLVTLAIWQGSHLDEFRDERPGQIMDEMRRGEGVTFEEQPHLPSFACADATPLFLVLLDEYERWTGDADLVRTLEYEARAAVNWIDEYADLMGNGYVSYPGRGGGGPKGNQCWKNSWDAVCYHDGRLPGFPRATAELQGYAYDAKMRAARLAREVWSDPGYGDRLEREANDLKQRFNRDFWLDDRQYFALALDADGSQVDALTSNIGHLLWSGIVEEDKSRPVVEHLLGPRLFSGWGVRTLAEGEARYNPVGYHVGTVWPFDNSLIAWGLRRYGYAEEAARIAAGILDAAVIFGGRLPETFGGYPRALTRYPVRYPNACSPQALSAGTSLLLLRTMLGIEPKGGKLTVRPALPINLGHLRLLDVPGRWGRADAYGRGLVELDRRQGLYPQLGLPDPKTPKQMRG